MVSPPPLVMIGLDAMELRVVERLLVSGALPNLADLRRRGCLVTLESTATRFAGGVWPTFATGREVPWHGVIQHRMWRPERMEHALIDDDWLPELPLWRRLPEGMRAAVIDVPMVTGPPRPFDGVHLSGWGTHDLLHRGSFPEALWRDTERRYGAPVILPAGAHGPPTPAVLERILDELIDGTDQIARISADLLARERWDLFMTVLGAAHRGGHHFWDLSQIDAERTRGARRQRLAGALETLYGACDRALGRILDAAPTDARIVAFAVHGMGENPGWSERCGDLLARLARPASEPPPSRGIVHELKRALSPNVRSRLRALVPAPIRRRLSSLAEPRYDWSSTRFFPLDMDHAGYVRINLKGREAEGIVEPADYDAVCDEVAVGLSSFRDVETGRPVVARVLRRAELAPPDAPYVALLPDLVVMWGELSAIRSRAVTSPTYGTVRWADGGVLPSGRSGNHTDRAWCLAAGPGIPEDQDVAVGTLPDLTATVFAALGLDVPDDVQGRPLPVIRS